MQAAKVNGLYGDNLKPWHLRVSYKLLDPSGGPTDQGSIEEFWAGPKVWKLTITGSATKLVYLKTEATAYREGDLDQKTALLKLIASGFIEPMPFSEKSLAFLDLSLGNRAIGATQLPCFTLKARRMGPKTWNSPTYLDPTYCLENNSPMIRIASFADDSHWLMSNQVAQFQGRYIPSDVTAGVANKTDLRAHLDILDQVSNFDPAVFKPGANAVLQRMPETTIIIPDGMLDGMVERGHVVRAISCPQPTYPASAQAAKVHGTVSMRATIGTDGHIAALHVIDGPELLQQAALDAVWRWRFEEPFHDAQHVQVLTVIRVHL